MDPKQRVLLQSEMSKAGEQANRASKGAIVTKNVTNTALIPSLRWPKKWHFRHEKLWVDFENHASHRGGEHIFEKRWKQNACSGKVDKETISCRMQRQNWRAN